MNEQKNNGRGIFYGVIGVATLVVAIIGATFAYFTATASDNNVITGNMATITFDLAVEKVTTADEAKGGMIPMSNSMVEAALAGKTDVNVGAETNPADPAICVDDNGNAVCQVYKISVVNGGTAGMFLDGYVTLTGGSGTATDVENWENLTGEGAVTTTMRWAQAFCTGTDDKLTSCTTAGRTTTSIDSAVTGSGFNADWATIAKLATADTTSGTIGMNRDQIVETGDTVTTTGKISGNDYDLINQNYIRISDRAATATTYDRATDVTSALVFNEFIAPSVGTTLTDASDSVGVDGTASAAYTDTQVYYIVVWLSETGTNQNPAESTDVPNPNTLNFFRGNVTFISAQGSEVTATFSSYSRVARTD